MHVDHDGRRFYVTTPLIRQPRHSKPHIAMWLGRWWSSGVGHYADRVNAQLFVVTKNKESKHERH